MWRGYPGCVAVPSCSQGQTFVAQWQVFQTPPIASRHALDYDHRSQVRRMYSSERLRIELCSMWTSSHCASPGFLRRVSLRRMSS